ncbi:DNA topoisomerase [Bacillus sp. TS-2]|nr:DNA topoisomerase [Bacillus sp. TS-2]
MKLILTEKPSVAKNIADALKIRTKKDGYFEGNGYIITWAFGHLLQLYDAKDYHPKMRTWKMENFPFIPDKFEYKIKSNIRNKQKSDSGAKKQMSTIKRLMNRKDVIGIISACDFDREGQIIGDSIIYNNQTKKPVERLLLNEWTPKEIMNGLQQLKPNEQLKPLQDAGVSRQWADWLIGINLTSVATLKYQKGKGKALNIGRVLLPTLKIIYDRDQEIAQFKSERFYRLEADFKSKSGEAYTGIYHFDKKSSFKDKDPLHKWKEQIVGQPAEVVNVETSVKKEFPPFLFNLSNLQGYITSKYNGWTSDKVLKVAQSLYEKKYITYPRTSSIALDESLMRKTEDVLNKVKQDLDYEEEVRFSRSKRIFNNQKVESHSAIIPTYIVPKKLTNDEDKVYQAIKNRFIMQFMPISQYEENVIETKILIPEMLGTFFSKGRRELVKGWKKVEQIKSKEYFLPDLQKKEQVMVKSSQITEHDTEPPKPHSEKSLLNMMQTCGRKSSAVNEEEILSGFSIGTAATRADTIKKLREIGYIKIDKKSLFCTELGKKLVETFPIQSLFNLNFTGKLEKALADIEKEKVRKHDFLSFIYDFTEKSVNQIKNGEEVTIHETVQMDRKKQENLGKCLNCGHPVIEGVKGFGCSNWKQGCKFVIWKNDKYLLSMKKKPSKTMVKSLLKNGKVLVKGLTSKNGKKFNAYLSYQKNKENDYFSWSMEFMK